MSEANAANDQAERGSPSIVGKAASGVASFFSHYFYRIGLVVGTRPLTTISLTCLFVLLCAGGFSQMNSETRSDKLWTVQDTTATADQKTYDSYFPPTTRVNSLMMEAKSGSAVDKSVLTEAITLHDEIEKVKAGDDTLRTLCISRPGQALPCFISSILELWDFSASKLANDANPLATINAAGKTKDDLARMLGGAVFDSTGKLQSAKVIRSTYFLQSNREQKGGGYEDKRGDDWELEFLKKLGCEDPKCTDDDHCTCSYAASTFNLYVMAQRSWSDVFGDVIRGDVGLINAAFFIMIVYVTLNLGGLCHKVNQRALLALGCIVSIVLAGVAGYGLAMWFQIIYSPVMSVMPFVLIGIGVDDSFVIMNSLDGIDPSLPVPERIAKALSHAGVSIFMTSMTDFVAFAISMSSALPALSAFCGFAALSILMLFVLQVTVFTAFATLDARRVKARRIDCCPCLCSKGCPCCPIVPPPEDMEGGRDRNQLCCFPHAHKGGRFGAFLENIVAPALVKPPVAIAVVLVAVGFAGICSWQASLLAVEEATPKFVPDDSYLQTTLAKQDQFFGSTGTSFDMVTEKGDYFATQAALVDIGPRLDKLSFVKPSTSDTFESWAASYHAALKAGLTEVGTAVAVDTNGHATDKAQYYNGLKAWLSGKGGKFRQDIVWNDASDAQQGIRASRIHAELISFTFVKDDKVLIDDQKAVEVMDKLRDACNSWKDLPGGKAIPYNYKFLTWESFRILRKEIFMSLGLCLAAVFVLILVMIAHPATAFLVFLCVLLVIVDILGCMNMWGLAIDSVTVIQLVIAVGLSVDYAAHIGHSFMTTNGTRSDRVISTLGDVGSAVLNGGVSTFLAVMLLALSKSYVFRVLFQTFFLTVVFGLFHGMIVLPAVLGLAGPAAYAGYEVADGAKDPDAKGVGKAVEDSDVPAACDNAKAEK